jgi:hypothetical protein
VRGQTTPGLGPTRGPHLGGGRAGHRDRVRRTYPGATKLQDHPGNGANSIVKWVGDSGATLQRSWVQCADGKTAVGGGYSRADEGVAAIKSLQVVTSSPAQIQNGAEVYQPIAGDAAGSVKPNAWLVEGFNNGTTDLIVRPWVVCAKIS